MLTPEQVLEAHKANLDKFLGLGQRYFGHVEKAIALNLDTVKSALEDNTSAIKALAGARDIQDFVAVSTSVGQPLSEKAVAYGKDVYSLTSGMIAEMAQLAEQQVADANRRFVELFETATKNAPAGSEGALALVKSAMTAANTAYESVSKATKQAVEMAEANVEAASKATLKAASAAAASNAKSRKAA